ncbi:MAG TPA: MarR family transcriptional regulator [Caulobacteraceae bacterium]
MAKTGPEGVSEPQARRPYDYHRYLPYHLTFPVGAISRVLAEAMHSRFGLKSAHWRIMSLLGSQGPVSTRDLAGYLSTEKSAISRATTELISRGYVLRVLHPLDRRLLMLHFSPKGKRLFEQMSAVALDYEDALLRHVSPEEVAQLDAILGKLHRAALDYEGQRQGRRGRRRASEAAEAPPSAGRGRSAKA